MAATASPSTSLRRRTLISFGSAVLVMLVLLVAVIIALSAVSESNNWRDTLTDIASRSEDQVAIFLQRGRDLLNLVDSITAAETEQDNPEHIESIITSILTTNTAVREIAVIRRDGTINTGDAVSNPALLLTDPAQLNDAAWYQAALRGETYTSPVEFTADTPPFVILSQPLTMGGVVAIVLDMNVLRDAISLFDDEDPTTTYIIDESGDVILHPDSAAVPVGAIFPDSAALQQLLTSPDDSITLEYATFNNQRALGAFNRVDGSNWIVVREAPREGIFSFTRTIALGLVIGGLVLWGVIMGTANLFLRRFYFQPVEMLRQGADRVRNGDLDVRLQPRFTDEIGTVMSAFNTMIDQLKMRTSLSTQLFSISQRIANAHTPADLAGVIYSAADPAALVGVNFTYVDNDAQQEPDRLTIAAVQMAPGLAPTVQAGMTFRVADVPFTKLWLMNKQEPVFVEDVRTDARVDDTTRGILLAASAIRSVFIPVTQSGRWVAVVPVSWSEARPFDASERELYATAPALLAPIADNLRLIENLEANVQQIVAAQSETASLYDLSQQFANARSYDDVIQAILTDFHVEGAFYINFTRVETADDGSRTLIYAAHQSVNAAPFPIPIGQRFDFDAFPFARILENSQSSVLLDDALNAPNMDAATRGMLELVGVASVAIVPLTQADRWIGLISIGWNQPHTFTEQQHAFYRALPVLAAPVMDNLNLIAQLEANVQRVETAQAETAALYRVSQQLANAHDFTEVMDAVYQQVKGYQPDSLTLNTIETNEADEPVALRYVADMSPANPDALIPLGKRFAIDEFPLAKLSLSSSQQTMLIDDSQTDPRVDPATRQMLSMLQMPTLAIIPITQAGRWIGVASIAWNAPHRFTKAERALYRALPTLLAPVIENLRLIDELEANVQALSEARARAEDSNRLKGEFLSTMSHELRTPLNAIEGFTGIMLTGMGGFELEPAPRRMVERVRLNSRRLLGLVNDFLDLSRIEAGRVEIVNEPFQPAKLAARWTAEIGVLAENKGVALSTVIEPDLPAVLLGDEDALTKIAANLLSNAVKFTEQGSITLRLFRTGEQWAMQVQDTGIGIPKAAQGYIFDEFRQVDGSTTRKYGGTGLGLAIVQKFVRLINGRIQLESEVDRGSTFTVYVPLLLPTNQPTTQPVTA